MGSEDQVRAAADQTDNALSAGLPGYVKAAMRGLTPTQKRAVIDGCFHGDVSMATVRALKSRALFYFKPTSPNGRCGPMVLTPLGMTVQAILTAKASSAAANPNTAAVSE